MHNRKSRQDDGFTGNILGQADRSDLIAVQSVIILYRFVIRVHHEVELDRIKADNFKARATLIAGHSVALFTLGIDKDLFAAFGTN